MFCYGLPECSSFGRNTPRVEEKIAAMRCCTIPGALLKPVLFVLSAVRVLVDAWNVRSFGRLQDMHERNPGLG